MFLLKNENICKFGCFILNTLGNGGGEMRSSCQQVQHVGHQFTVPVVSGIIYPDLSETWYILGWKLNSILDLFSTFAYEVVIIFL